MGETGNVQGGGDDWAIYRPLHDSREAFSCVS
jgi:hypothetical protein